MRRSSWPVILCRADVQHDGGNVAFLRGAASIDVLSWVDYVVTDYSAVAFEAAVASKKVLFYVPTFEEVSSFAWVER